jgi:hypothetical protein
MLDLLRAIRRIISRYIVNQRSIVADASPGDSTISVESVHRFNVGDQLAIYMRPEENAATEAEIKYITEIPDVNTLVLDSELTGSYAANDSAIEKTVAGTFLRGIYLGNPPILPAYPAITIHMMDKDNSPLTLDSTTEDFSVAITIWINSEDYDLQYQLMLYYASQIENSLFRSLYPLVEPYSVAYLADPVEPDDTLIHVAEGSPPLYPPCDAFLESPECVKLIRLAEDLGNGVYRLAFVQGKPFAAGDSVIRPHRAFYMTMPSGIKVADIQSADGPLTGARLIYVAKEERRRLRGYYDPMLV